MRTLIAILTTLLLTGVLARAQTPPQTERNDDIAGVRFTYFDVFINAGDAPLGAYQIDIRDLSGKSVIVGVEGGAHDAYKTPPYYDPAALYNEGRIILAAYTTGDDAPTGKTRVARLHLQIDGEQAPDFDVQLIVAADADGQEFDATATISKGND